MKLSLDRAVYNELFPAIELRETGKYQEAQEWLSLFITNHPNHPESLSLLCQVLMLDKNDAEAQKVLAKALSINPNLPSIHRNQAKLLLKQSKPEEALRALQFGPEYSTEDPEDWLILATCLGANQREQEALLLIEKVLLALPNHAEAFANRAVLRLKKKDITGAIKDAEMTVSLKPHLVQIWALLGFLRHKSSNLTGAIKAITKAHQIEPTNLDHINNLAEFHRQDGNILETIFYFEKAISLVSVDVNLWTKLGVALQQAQKNSRAKVAYEKALAINPKSAEILSNLGTIAGDSNEWQSAVQYFEKALAINPRLAQVHNNMGAAQQKIDRLEKAVLSHKKAITLKPDYTEAYNNLGITLQSLGELEQAEVNYKHAIALKPDYAEAYCNLGNVLKELGKLEQAEASYRQSIVLKPDYAEVHNNLGVTLKTLGSLDQAIASYRLAIALEPNYAEAHNNLGTALKALGKLEQANASYRHAISLKPNSAEIQSNLANVLRSLGCLEQAEAIYRHAIALRPDYAKAYYDLGTLLLRVKNYAEAVEYLKFSDFKQSRQYLLRALYLMGEKSLFYEQLDYFINQGEIHPIIGSLGCRAALRYGVEKPNLFCKKPLDYVLNTDLSNQYDFVKVFIKTTKTILNENRVRNRKQGMLSNGYQTHGNLFDLEPDLTKDIQKVIRLEIDKYKNKFQESEEGLINNWPTDYNLYGWLIRMNSGGELQPHMHEKGWISGSIYINVPPKSKTESGNLVVCIEDKLTSENRNQGESINVVTGSLCLFPASLLHYTIPFESEEERIVLAFDVSPKY
jgi:tetratricopeptide (TPR) repeat protein